MNNRIITLLCVLALLTVSATAASLQYSTVTYTPAPTAPGQLITVWVTLKNTTNSTATDVTVIPKPNYPFSVNPTGNNQLNFSSIGPYQSVTGKLDIQIDKQALNGTYPLEIQATEADGTGGIVHTLSVQVLSYKPQIEIITATLPSATPGQVIEASIEIRNIGSSRATNILLGTSDDRVVTSTGAIVDRPIKNIGSTLLYLDTLEPGQSKIIPIQFGIDSTAEQKTHLVPIKIKFQDENRSDYENTRYLGLRVQADAELDAYFTYDAVAKPIPGNTQEISVNLFNRGAATARNIVVEVMDNNSMSILSEKKIFIGTLDSDDFDSFKINTVIKKETTPGQEYPVKIRFEYKNQDNQTQTVEKEIPLTVFDPIALQANGSGGGIDLGLILIVIVLLVAAFFGYKRFFGKKTANK